MQGEVYLKASERRAPFVIGRQLASNVTACCRGRQKSLRGWEFKYTDGDAAEERHAAEVWKDVVLQVPGV
eukprot:1315262-Amphidinium_carterae.1